MTISPAERKRRARQVERRAEAVRALRAAESVAGYAAGVVGNGASPAEARGACLEAAAGLTQVAASLRRLTRMSAPERRALARRLAAVGMPTGAIAAQLGVCDRTVRFYVHGRGG